MKRSLDVARRLTAPGLDRDPESFAPPGLDRELNESSSTKGTASDLGISELQNSVTASGRTIPVEDARSVNRHSQTRSGGAGERFSPAESSSRLYLTLKQQQKPKGQDPVFETDFGDGDYGFETNKTKQ